MIYSLKTKGLILVFLTALCWGPNFLFIKVAVQEIPPVTLVFLRVALGTLFLYLVCLLQKIDLWKWRHYWKEFSIMAILMNVVPFTLIAWGELYISSALAGILNCLAVISIAIVNHYFGVHEPLTKNKVAGISLGIFGFVIIYLPLLLKEHLGDIAGVFMLVVACVFYGFGSAYVRRHLQKVPSMEALTSQMIWATILLLPLSLIIDRPFFIPSTHVVESMLALGVIGSGLGFIFYYKAMASVGATYATLAVLLLAIFAVILGAVFLGEKITWNMYLGAFFILTSLLVINPVFTPTIK